MNERQSEVAFVHTALSKTYLRIDQENSDIFSIEFFTILLHDLNKKYYHGSIESQNIVNIN